MPKSTTMGCCCSCCASTDDGDDAPTPRETEMASLDAKKLVVSRGMSQPSIKLDSKTSRTLSGHGLALAGVPVEQDAAYWEWHVECEGGKTTDDVAFGVASKKDQNYYKSKGEKGEQDDEDTKWMRPLEGLQSGDVVGVAVQQSDLPMVQFLLNGEPLHELAINRFRGTVYPSICLPEAPDLALSITLEMMESNFKHMSSGARFGPVIVARSIV